MVTNTLTGSDTIQIGDRVFADLPNGDVLDLTYPNELVTVTIGKNGNAIHALNETGKQADVVLRVLRASPDDKFLNSLKLTMESDLAAFTLLEGKFTKRMGDGAGNISSDIYTVSGGSFKQGIDVKSNVEGDTEQAVSVYRFTFTNAPRAIA